MRYDYEPIPRWALDLVDEWARRAGEAEAEARLLRAERDRLVEGIRDLPCDCLYEGDRCPRCALLDTSDDQEDDDG